MMSMKYIQVFVLLIFTFLAACVPKPVPGPVGGVASSVCSDTAPVLFVGQTGAKPYGIVASDQYVYWVDVLASPKGEFAVVHSKSINYPNRDVELAFIPLGSGEGIPSSDARVTGLAVDEKDGVAVVAVQYSKDVHKAYILKRKHGSPRWDDKAVNFRAENGEASVFSRGLVSGVAYHDGIAYLIQLDGQKKLYKLNLADPSAVAEVSSLDFITNHANRKQDDSLVPPRLGGLEVVGDYLYFTDPSPFLPPQYKDEWLFRVPLSGGVVEVVAMSDATMDADRYAILIDYYDGVFYTGSKGDDLYYWNGHRNVKLTPNLSIDHPQFFGVAANSKYLFFTSFNDQKIYKMCRGATDTCVSVTRPTQDDPIIEDSTIEVNGGKAGIIPVPEICKVSHGCPWCIQGLCPGFSLTFEEVSGFDIQVVNSSGQVMSKAYGKANIKTLQVERHEVTPNKKRKLSGNDLFIQFDPKQGTKLGSHQVKVEITQNN